MNKLIFVRLNIIRNIIFKSATSNPVVPIISNNKFEIKRYLNYKTPVNRTKTFSPSTIAVTNANKHLIIDLFDENNVNLGQMRLDKAKELADGKNLKLVITEETSAPPKFALMNGHSLYQLQMKYREANKDNVKEQKFKEIEVNLGIDDHDLDIKIKMLKNFFEKGDLIKFKVLSKIINKKDKNIPKLQEDFIKKMQSLVTFTKLEVEKKTNNMITFSIGSERTENKN